MVLPILIVGAGGHGRSALTLLRRHGGFNPIGFIDSINAVGASLYGLDILGRESDIESVCKRYSVSHIFLAIGNNFHREAIALRLRRQLPSAIFPPIVDPSAVVSPDIKLNSGVIIFPMAHVGSGCILEQGSFINTKSSLDHDCSLGSYASLAPGAITGGNVIIGSRSFIGLGAHVIQNVRIGHDTVVGAGSLVLRDQPDGIVAYGSPAQFVRTHLPHDPYF